MAKYFKFSSNKSPLSYFCGEKMIFTIFAKEDGKKIPCNRIDWEIQCDDGKSFKGTGSCTENIPLVLETTLERAGFVHIICTSYDENGNRVEGFDVLDAGVGAEVRTIEYHDAIPADFDAYWAEIEKTVADFPLEVVYSNPITEGVREGYIAYDVRVKTPVGRPASGIVTIPEKEGKYPVRLLFNGYTISGSSLNYYDNAIVANFNAHGMENFRSKELHEEYEVELKDYGFSEEENKSNKTTYFRNMMIRNLIAAKYVKTIPQWDGENLTSCGGSQGALQATTVAAHNKDITFLDIDVPWFCDLNGINKGYLSGWRPKFAEGLRYFDTVAQGTRVKCPVRIVARLGDYICPPTTVMALYNSINAEKQLKFVQSGTHAYVPPEIDEYYVE